jgi:hypothetical protein
MWTRNLRPHCRSWRSRSGETPMTRPQSTQHFVCTPDHICTRLASQPRHPRPESVPLYTCIYSQLHRTLQGMALVSCQWQQRCKSSGRRTWTPRLRRCTLTHPNSTPLQWQCAIRYYTKNITRWTPHARTWLRYSARARAGWHFAIEPILWVRRAQVAARARVPAAVVVTRALLV